MKDGNQSLDEFLQLIKSTPCGETVKAPWGSMPMGDDNQAAAAALIQFGVIGMSERGGLYKGRDNAGKPFSRLIHGWLLYPLVLAYLMTLSLVAKNHSDFATWGGLALSVVVFVYSANHFTHAARHAQLYIAGLGRMGEVARLGSLALAFFASAGAMAGLIFGRLI